MNKKLMVLCMSSMILGGWYTLSQETNGSNYS